MVLKKCKKLFLPILIVSLHNLNKKLLSRLARGLTRIIKKQLRKYFILVHKDRVIIVLANIRQQVHKQMVLINHIFTELYLIYDDFYDGKGVRLTLLALVLQLGHDRLALRDVVGLDIDVVDLL